MFARWYTSCLGLRSGFLHIIHGFLPLHMTVEWVEELSSCLSAVWQMQEKNKTSKQVNNNKNHDWASLQLNYSLKASPSFALVSQSTYVATGMFTFVSFTPYSKCQADVPFRTCVSHVTGTNWRTVSASLRISWDGQMSCWTALQCWLQGLQF